MEEADQLCEQLFLLLEKQEQCIAKLLAAAQELENLHLGSNIVQAAGNAAAVGGFVASGFATLATVLTGGLALPLVVAGIGTAVSLAPKAVESGVSHHTIKEAKKHMEEVEEIRDKIQTLLNELNEKCASQGQGASAASSDECEVTIQIMGALARRHSMDVPPNFLRRFNETTIINQQRLDQGFALPLITTGAALLMNAGKVLANTGLTGMKLGIKGAAKVAGSFAGAALAAWDLSKNINEIRDNQTEASRSLRATAREMEENARNLRKMMDKLQEIVKKLSEFRTLLKDLGGYSLIMTEAGQKVLDYTKATCHEDPILSWVDENQAHFLNLFRFLRDYLQKPLKEEIKKQNRRHVHIVFVAHGSITGEFMPASALVPTRSITDTILYSPWNCGIDARAASGIAEGCIRPHLREFYNPAEPDILLKYDRVPQRWNSMRESTNKVPQILLRAVTPKEPVWKTFEELGGSVYRDDRIIIPYLQEDPEAPHIPFYMLIFAASYILDITRVTATVHLAACLGRGENRPVWDEWAAQYSYTEDGTQMTADIEALGMDPLLRQAFRMMFDNDNQQ